MVSRARSSGENMIEQSNVQTDPLQFDGINSGQSNPATELSRNISAAFELIFFRTIAYNILRMDSLFQSGISEKNKANQNQKKLVQTTGKESYALVRERKRAELGHEPSRMDMFIECHSKKDENRTPSTVEAANYMAQMHEKREKLSEGSQDLPAENDILSQVVGKDKYGRVRMYGLGVSQSDVWGQIPSRKQSQRIAMEWKENCEQMEERFNNRIDELKSMFLRHRGREESQSDACSPATSINHRPQMTSTQLPRPFRVRDVVCLKSIMNPSETVAKGIIQSIDPSTEVGGEELGPNWCEVSIQVAVKKDECLIRSYGFHKTIYDAYGATVAWPCPYVELESVDEMSEAASGEDDGGTWGGGAVGGGWWEVLMLIVNGRAIA
ncbi:hypothetical protein RJ639_026473 [Escallonia herrerae]|uniref:Transposase Tnp1/En/Spm-like domain-containing protein n=2 Tax=Escallonia herrerae TaxID=1293975 RepID=A0AA88USZ6_9ASTE|nr:hypothetical protein RJ639_026473 [Escallonia herrerae]